MSPGAKRSTLMSDRWLILLCGGMYVAVPLSLLIVDRRNQRRRRRAADELTALWDDDDYFGSQGGSDVAS